MQSLILFARASWSSSNQHGLYHPETPITQVAENEQLSQKLISCQMGGRGFTRTQLIWAAGSRSHPLDRSSFVTDNPYVLVYTMPQPPFHYLLGNLEALFIYSLPEVYFLFYLAKQQTDTSNSM